MRKILIALGAALFAVSAVSVQANENWDAESKGETVPDCGNITDGEATYQWSLGAGGDLSVPLTLGASCATADTTTGPVTVSLWVYQDYHEEGDRGTDWDDLAGSLDGPFGDSPSQVASQTFQVDDNVSVTTLKATIPDDDESICIFVRSDETHEHSTTAPIADENENGTNQDDRNHAREPGQGNRNGAPESTTSSYSESHYWDHLPGENVTECFRLIGEDMPDAVEDQLGAPATGYR